MMEFLVQRCLLLCLYITSALGVAKASLMSNTSVACPGEAVLFTCSSPGTALIWQVDLLSPTGTSLQSFFLPSQVGIPRTLESGVIIFEAVLVSNDGGNLTSTLINLSEVSVLDDSNVTCTVTNNGPTSQQQTIMVAVVPTRPLNPSISYIQNQLSSSIITLDWDPPSSTGGVSVSYVLIISPTPLSGSPVTMDTTSTQITVSYSTPYDVTIRAVNCAGMSQESSIVDLIVCPTPSTAAGVTITNTPPVTIGGSMLTFTCSGDNEVIISTCGSSGWSPDPKTFECRIDPQVTCGSPATPSRGSVDVSGETPCTLYTKLTSHISL
ncbi:titin-like [Halichondria panicea]|uniref:titin-like n=1 Tax=Halichondria panicea TaxID=6063 RepID=UPI00312BA8B8